MHRIAVGKYHACRIDTTASVWCWGGNSVGQIGDGTYSWSPRVEGIRWNAAERRIPVELPRLRGRAKQVVAGETNTCVTTFPGELWCWGDQESDLVSPGYSPVPRQRKMKSRIREMALHTLHTCATGTDGRVWCWGWNEFGQLGNDQPTERTPMRFPRRANLVEGIQDSEQSVCVGANFTCTLRSDHKTQCWGDNQFGALSMDSSLRKRASPTTIPAPPSNQIACSDYGVCTLFAGDSLFCWGSSRAPRRIGFGLPHGIRSIGMETDGILLLDSSGWIWEAFRDSAARKVELPAPAQEMSSHANHACALLIDESVWCWGHGQQFRLDNGDSLDSPRPYRIRFPATKPARPPARR